MSIMYPFLELVLNQSHFPFILHIQLIHSINYPNYLQPYPSIHPKYVFFITFLFYQFMHSYYLIIVLNSFAII